MYQIKYFKYQIWPMYRLAKFAKIFELMPKYFGLPSVIVGNRVNLSIGQSLKATLWESDVRTVSAMKLPKTVRLDSIWEIRLSGLSEN